MQTDVIQLRNDSNKFQKLAQKHIDLFRMFPIVANFFASTDLFSEKAFRRFMKRRKKTEKQIKGNFNEWQNKRGAEYVRYLYQETYHLPKKTLDKIEQDYFQSLNANKKSFREFCDEYKELEKKEEQIRKKQNLQTALTSILQMSENDANKIDLTHLTTLTK